MISTNETNTTFVLQKIGDTRYWSRNMYNVYAFGDSYLSKLADEWYDEAGIWRLSYKSKVWNKITRKVNSNITSLLKEYFKTKKVQYSSKAGCNCGCSPGYVVRSIFSEVDDRDLATPYKQRDVFFEVKNSNEEVEDFLIFLDKMKVELELELLLYKKELNKLEQNNPQSAKRYSTN